MSMARTPMIKFLGPRDQLKKQPELAPTPIPKPQTQTSSHKFVPLTSGTPLTRPSVFYPKL